MPKPEFAPRIKAEAGEISSTHGLKIHWNLEIEPTLVEVAINVTRKGGLNCDPFKIIPETLN